MGFHYGNAESLDNLDMMDWEIKRIKLLLDKKFSLESLREDIEAILSEIEIVLKLRGLDKDKKKRLNSQKMRLLGLKSHMEERIGASESQES